MILGRVVGNWLYRVDERPGQSYSRNARNAKKAYTEQKLLLLVQKLLFVGTKMWSVTFL